MLHTGGINTMSVKRDREAAGLAGEDEVLPTSHHFCIAVFEHICFVSKRV